MKKAEFDTRVEKLFDDHNKLTGRRNKVRAGGNGIYDRYVYPVITRDHTPVFWRYDLDHATNPHLMTRLGINTTFNAGAIKLNGKYYMAVRTEGFDVKSFFAIAESPNGIDKWRFWDHPVAMPVTDDPE
ncbi:MAG: glycosidase, partial [Bacteroidales bacterium]|nr:glycosidase [Bacteroidales bacterium]